MTATTLGITRAKIMIMLWIAISISAEKGDAEAHHQLGLCYFHGHGVKQDPEQAKAC